MLQPTRMSPSLSPSSPPPSHYVSACPENMFGFVTTAYNWTEQDVKAFLEHNDFQELAAVCEEQALDGPVLLNLDFDSLKDLGVHRVGRRLRLMRLINQLNYATEDFPDIEGEGDAQHHVWSKFNAQDDRIRFLEDQLWELKVLTQSLRERTDSLVSFSSSWAAQSSTQSSTFSKFSSDSTLTTAPITASSTRTVITTAPLDSSQKSFGQPSQLNSSGSSMADEPGLLLEAVTPCNPAEGECFLLVSPTNLPLKSIRRRSNSHPNVKALSNCAEGESTDDQGLTDASSASDGTTVTLQSEDILLNGAPTPTSSISSNPWSRKPTGPATHGPRQRSSYGFLDLHRKFSASKLEAQSNSVPGITHHSPPSHTSSKLNAGLASSGAVVARKPSLLSRRARSPIIANSPLRGVTSNETRAGTVVERSNLTCPPSSAKFPDQPASPQSNSKPTSNFSTSVSHLDRSASTSNLTFPKTVTVTNDSIGQLSSETSVRVKSNSEQTVIEVLANHLSNFYVNDPHAWAKHVLIVRIQNTKEHCLSYDDIPLKVYRSLKSRDGVDFAIRSVEELPSPLRITNGIRKKDIGFSLEDELNSHKRSGSTDDDSKINAHIEPERKPLAWGLAICGYQAEQPDELNIKPGEVFKIKAYTKKRYLLEREASLLSTSPLSALGSSALSMSPSPTRQTTSGITTNTPDHTGWVAENCILESTKSMRTLTSNGSSLKHLISKPAHDSVENLDLTRTTTYKLCLVGFHSQSINWSGELVNVQQGEQLRAFNRKTRSHWTYCLRESNGERGWFPNWILSDNLHTLPPKFRRGLQGHNKLQTFLLQQQASTTKPISNPRSDTIKRGVEAQLSRSLSSAALPTKLTLGSSTLSSTTLRAAREHHLGLSFSRGVVNPATPLDSPLGRSIKSKEVDSDGTEASDSTTLAGSNLHRSITDGSRAHHFSPRRRRSRINPIMES